MGRHKSTYYYFCGMHIVQHIQEAVVKALNETFGQPFTASDFQINQIKQEFKGDYSVVLFPLLKRTGLSPQALGEKLIEALQQQQTPLFKSFELIKGFLNIEISDAYWVDFLNQTDADTFGQHPSNGRKAMVEYSSPNTNKPLHLGHLRNNFLGWSIAAILKANGYEVYKSCIINDRGIHICKSMIAWQHFANGATPESTQTKGDHFVGMYYVKFNDAYKAQVKELISSGLTEKEAEQQAPLMKEAQQMLIDWEAGKPEVMELWKRMNGWVYEGFDVTYKKIGSDFDRQYYESQTYLLGKEIVQMGLEKGVFYRKEDSSVWIDLTADGLDEKLVLRKDGTSVYITQDIGLALQKYEQYHVDENIYVIGDEQNYHMKVLKLICEKLDIPNAQHIHHLSYGMVELPTGRMKSREGTVVDADDIVDEMIQTARMHTESLGKVSDFTEDELNVLYETLGLGAMKFYLLRVDPKKKMIFNPQESIDFHGFTGPFIQYSYARIQSILRKASGEATGKPNVKEQTLFPAEKDILVHAEQFPQIIAQAGKELNPSLIATYAFTLAKLFNTFYTEHSVLQAESEVKKWLRLCISHLTARILATSMKLLGIQVPERM